MNPERDRQAPLTGIRVVDFGHYIAGPLTGMLLADQGAEVIKVDRPGKPDWDTPANGVFNRGKQHITLDLKNADDLATAVKLIRSADVVIENFRPGVMQRLGLGAEEMTALNPGLVYLSLPGFASTDERASIRAFEGIISAAIGQYTDLQREDRICRLFIRRCHWVRLMGRCWRCSSAGAVAFPMVAHCSRQCGRWSGVQVRQHFIN